MDVPKNRAPWLHPFAAAAMIGIDLLASDRLILGRTFFFILPIFVFVVFILSLALVWKTRKYLTEKQYKMHFLQKLALRFSAVLFFIIILPIFCLVIGSYFIAHGGPTFNILSSTYTHTIDNAASLGYFRFSPLSLANLKTFAAAFIIVTWIQFRFAKNKLEPALFRALIAAILCALPAPIFGTAVGSYILIKNGLDFLNEKYTGKKN